MTRIKVQSTETRLLMVIFKQGSINERSFEIEIIGYEVNEQKVLRRLPKGNSAFLFQIVLSLVLWHL